MSIIQGICTSFKRELFQAIHDFDTDVIKVALYTSAADLSAITTAYSTANEVVGAGYVAGGATLTPTVTTNGSTICIDFADVEWPAATITARGALIYNSSKANRAIMALNFGSDRVVTAATFPLRFPVPDTNSAIIRL